MTTLEDVKLISLKTFFEPDGKLVPIESEIDIPFQIKRIFYVFGVHNQNDRGKHSHYKTKQVLICLNGEVTVKCDDGHRKNTWKLNKSRKDCHFKISAIFRFNDTLSSVLEVWPEKEYLLEDNGWGFSTLFYYNGPSRLFSLSNVKFLNSLN